MATYKSYYNEYEKNNLSSVQKRIAEQQNKNTAMSNQYVADQNAIVDKNISNSVNKVQGEIDKLPTTYQASFDANAIQQKINERQVAERMANLGMTNSGLNRTQQTAINIQRSNADAAIRQQMNAATASLKQQIADLYASGESQKADIASKARYELEQKNQSVYDTGMTNFYSAADSYANQRLENDALIEKARIEAVQKAEANKPKLTEDQFNEAYELYDPNNENAFYDYIEKLELLGYGEDVLAELVSYVIGKKGKTVQRAWQGPIKPTTQSNNTTSSTKTANSTTMPSDAERAANWKGWSGLW